MQHSIESKNFFLHPSHILQKQYEALRFFYVENNSGELTAQKFGYEKSAFYSLTRDFIKRIKQEQAPAYFFTSHPKGRPQKDETGEIKKLILALRKRYLSVQDIKSVLDVQGYDVCETYIYQTIKNDGFGRLPRRNIYAKKQSSSTIRLEAPKAEPLSLQAEVFSVQNSLGMLCLLPYLEQYRIRQAIETSNYPDTKTINRLASIMSFIALKLSDVRRYTQDDAWCMDRGPGFFAKLTALPKAAWFTSYSHRVTRAMNHSFLKQLYHIFKDQGWVSDTTNLDFTAIPYWGDDSHLENNWSGTRHKALPSILALLAQDPESGIITYGDTTLRHKAKSKVPLTFLDFTKRNSQDKSSIRYIVFDSQFTTYENLARLDPDVLFLTIRRRGKHIVNSLGSLKSFAWKKIHVMAAHGKGRTLRVADQKVFLKDYGKEIRQIAITGHGKIKPALLMTNDFESTCEHLVHKYARRWLVEKEISEQIDFFHLNRISSSMVIKVDFDLTMSILSHNLLRLFAMHLEGYEDQSDLSLYNKFLSNNGSVHISDKKITIKLKKKRHLPAILTAMEPFQNKPLAYFNNRIFCVEGETFS